MNDLNIRKGDRVRFTQTYSGGTTVTTEGTVNEANGSRVIFGKGAKRDALRHLDEESSTCEVLERAKPEVARGQRYRNSFTGDEYLIVKGLGGELRPVNLVTGQLFSSAGSMIDAIRDGGNYKLIDGS